MAVTYVGSTDWEQATDPEWSVDAWGMDTMRILYRGKRTTMEDFEDTLYGQLWDAHSEYPDMYFSAWNTVPMTPSFPGIELIFIGFRTGVVPPVQKVDGNSVQQAQGSAVVEDPDGNEVTINGSFTYKASRTLYSWFRTSTPPTSSPYNTTTNTVDPLTQIVSYSFTDASGKSIGWVDYSDFVTVFNTLTRGAFVTDYTTEELVPDTLWRCSATVDYRII